MKMFGKGVFDWRNVKDIPEAEVHVPDELVFPFAEARQQAILSLKSPDEVAPTLPDTVLPFALEAGDLPSKDDVPLKVPEIKPNVRITTKRVFDFGPTEGCEACIFNAGANPELGVYHKKHTEECKRRFAALLEQEKGSNETRVEPTAVIWRSAEDSTPATTEALRSVDDPQQDVPPIYGSCTYGGGESSGGHGTHDDDVPQEGGVPATPEPISTDVAEADTATDPSAQVAPATTTDADVPSAFGMITKLRHGCKRVIFNMTNYIQQAVDHYISRTGEPKLRKASTPYCPPGSLIASNDEVKGELADDACSVLMKNLWGARLARPDLSRQVCRLASKVSKWTRNDDRRLQRLMEYMNSTKHYTLKAEIGDNGDDIELWLFVDADLAGDSEDTKSTSGGFLVIVGPSTWFPVTWIHNKQTATSRSTTEAESVSLCTSLVHEAYPVWDLLELILGRRVQLRVKEDNQATIKILKKGFSPKLSG